MGERKWLEKLEKLARTRYTEDPVHGWPHVERVLRLALAICRSTPGCDEDIVAAAALLHDVGRSLEERLGEHHALISARLAPGLLEEAGFPRDKVEDVVNAIASHSYSLGREPSSLEACVLRDADRLDAMGAVGVARAFAEGMRRSRGFGDTLRHFSEKLLLLNETLCTPAAREMGRRRHEAMLAFLRAFCSEAPHECPRELGPWLGK